MTWVETPLPPGFIRVIDVNELAGGPRLGGKFNGPKSSTSALWRGRPPVFQDGIGPLTLSIAGEPAEGTPGQTVTITVEVGNAWGGVISRRFNIGGGLSADIRVGNYQHVEVKAIPDESSVPGQVGIPDGFTLFFSWSFELQPKSRLFLFEPYLVGGVVIEAPQGCEFIHVETDGTITFVQTQFGATWSRLVVAGERVPCVWGAFSFSVPNQFIFESRGL